MQLDRKKKATMHMRLDQFVGEQSEQPSEDYSLDSQQHSWGRQGGRAPQQVAKPSRCWQRGQLSKGVLPCHEQKSMRHAAVG